MSGNDEATAKRPEDEAEPPRDDPRDDDEGADEEPQPWAKTSSGDTD